MALNTLTLGNVITAVKRQFGDESGVQITDDDIIRWTNQACTEINSKNKVLRSQAVLTIPTNIMYLETRVVGEVATLPDDAMTVTSIRYMADPSGDPIEYYGSATLLKSVGYDEWEKLQPGSFKEEGIPEVWTQYNDRILLAPFPPVEQGGSARGTLLMSYIPYPAKVTDNVDILPLPDRYFDRIIEFVMSKAYELDENWQGHQTQRQLFEDSLKEVSHIEADQEGPYIVVADADGW